MDEKELRGTMEVEGGMRGEEVDERLCFAFNLLLSLPFYSHHFVLLVFNEETFDA